MNLIDRLRLASAKRKQARSAEGLGQQHFGRLRRDAETALHGAIESLFALAYRGIRRGELVVRDGEPWDVLGLPRMVWRRVDRSRVTTDWFMMAMQHRYERRLDPHGLRVFQLVLPDSDGHLPWEPAYPEEERRYTAELWRPA